MKKLLSLFLVLALAISFCIPAFATVSPNSNGNDIISFEEYDAAIKAKYAEHHIKYECISYDKNFVFTKELLNKKLENIERIASDFTYDTTTNTFVESVPVSEPSLMTMTPQAFIGNVDHTLDVTAKSPSGMGSAQIRITINTAEDLQLSRFVGINSCTSRQYGAAVNFKSWKHGGSDLSMNSSRTWVNGTVYGTLAVEYTEPITGLRVTYTSDHSWAVGITPA